MKNICIGFLFTLLISCSSEDDSLSPINEVANENTEESSTTEENSSFSFSTNLSDYGIYQGNPSNLNFNETYKLYELSSVLFSDYAHKQRLIKIPEGEMIISNGDGLPNFPDGTIIVKTFYYYEDERDSSSSINLIETRLLIKESSTWNAATYVWNDDQTEAIYAENGRTIGVTWISDQGITRSINYEVPSTQDCFRCHQINEQFNPIGPKLRNLNIDVLRENQAINQLDYLQSHNILSSVDHNSINTLPNYEDTSISLSERGRAYLEINCAHCHNPQGWSRPAGEGFDFRYETPYQDTRIQGETNEIIGQITSGRMPFIGTTILDEEGVDMMVDYLNSL